MSESSGRSKQSCLACCENYLDTVRVGVVRKKALSADVEGLLKTSLRRCLKATDLVAYGLASMLGGSIYVLTGAVMQKKTGPSVFLAYMVAGTVALLNSLVYSELACRIPKAGSSYSYAYIMLGEFIAFLTGWSILLEYILGTATVARGWSSMLDGLTGGRISDWIIRNVGRMGNPGDVLAEYPDFIGAGLIIIFSAIACCGVRGGARLTAFFVVVYIGVLSVTSIYMFVYANGSFISPAVPSTVQDADPNSPNVNFLPFGVGGLVGGVAICFNAFIGFDAISACAEETKKPCRDLPRANVLAVTTVTLLTSVASLALVLYYPWFLVSPETPFLSGLRDNLDGGPVEARTGMFYFVGIGCLIGLTSSLLSSLVAGPRGAYAMAEDGLLPTFFAKVCHPFKTPIIATIFVAALTIILDILFSIVSLADFLSLGTLIAYSMASVGLLVLRYATPPEERDGLKIDAERLNYNEIKQTNSSAQLVDTTDPLIMRTGQPGYMKYSWAKCLPASLVRILNQGHRGMVVEILIPIYIAFNATAVGLIKTGAPESVWPIWRLVLVPIMLLLMVLCIIFMAAFVQHPAPRKELFRLPLVPFFPCATLTVNMFLIAELSAITWIRFAVWLAVGLLIYFFYGVYYSREAVANRKRLADEELTHREGVNKIPSAVNAKS
ncbi:High affinity cationic amino acid transporter 1 [Clonorchis sinensis]|uniref:High affinity cationic amino acid transporter 1 n=1 Tax=Clonorchis sinensis TaxID=79923 RepID=A0A3R7FW90_CLOSI|nr:High affinity cationic amino acid transporter 1 [Clonorchis sinensis]